MKALRVGSGTTTSPGTRAPGAVVDRSAVRSGGHGIRAGVPAEACPGGAGVRAQWGLRGRCRRTAQGVPAGEGGCASLSGDPPQAAPHPAGDSGAFWGIAAVVGRRLVCDGFTVTGRAASGRCACALALRAPILGHAPKRSDRLSRPCKGRLGQ